MNGTLDLINAIELGNSVDIQAIFEKNIAARVADRLDAKKQEVAKNMFQTEAADKKPSNSPKPSELHIKDHPEKEGHFIVHAVGKNWKDHISAGETLNDTELDDFAEIGGKIKHISESNNLEEAVGVSSSSKDYYKGVHGKSPKGEGNWAFSTDYKNKDAEPHFVKGTFSTASRDAIKHFKGKGHTGDIHVLS
jgi:hypothetical protein